MFELFLLSVGLVLIFEGLLYYFMAGRLNLILDKLNDFDPQIIKTFSIIIIVIGTCLIYFTLRFYR